MKKNDSIQGGYEEIISYQKLRTFIGITGISLPVAVVLGCFFLGAAQYSWQISISHYYYSKMHIVFVCILCVLGGFLITYKGKQDNPWESRMSNIAGFCAFGIVSFPTQFEGFRLNAEGTNQYIKLKEEVTKFWGGAHFLFAGALFVCFIIFCLHFFQKPDAPYTQADEIKKFNRRKRIYKICGWAIIVSIAMIVLFNFVIPPVEGFFKYSTFIFETTSLWAFGTAWLVKGSIIWKNIPVAKQIIKTIR
ncbi:MAG: hypothetical protein JST09_02780 [Bacteroidetes bacterium]|nr:hypothetical protein [Bacteroidota bacterium]